MTQIAATGMRAFFSRCEIRDTSQKTNTTVKAPDGQERLSDGIARYKAAEFTPERGCQPSTDQISLVNWKVWSHSRWKREVKGP